MASYSDANATDALDNSKVIIQGGTNNTTIGNVGDRLKVDATITALPTTSVQAWSNKLRYIDMNVASGGVARDTSISTTWVTVFKYLGSGYLAGALMNFETFTLWNARLLIDGVDIWFDSNGMNTDDLTADKIYDMDDVADLAQSAFGMSKGAHDRFLFSGPLSTPIYYTTSIEIQVRRSVGAPNKKFQAGLVVLSKET